MLNKVTIIGNIGSIESKQSTKGETFVNLSVATSENWTDKSTNEKKSKTEWHKVCVFGKLAEIANQYLSKGSKVYLEGALQTSSWQTKEGETRYATKVVVSGFNGKLMMLDKKQDHTENLDPAAYRGNDYYQDMDPKDLKEVTWNESDKQGYKF